MNNTKVQNLAASTTNKYNTQWVSDTVLCSFMPHVHHIMWNMGVSIKLGYSLFLRNFEWKLQRSIKNTRYDEMNHSALKA